MLLRPITLHVFVCCQLATDAVGNTPHAADKRRPPAYPLLCRLPAATFTTSPDGSKLVAATADCVTIYDTASGEELGRLPEPGVSLLHISPGQTCVVTACKPVKGEEGGAPSKNLKVWSLSDFSLVQVTHHSRCTRHMPHTVMCAIHHSTFNEAL